MSLDYSSLEKALQSLEQVFKRSRTAEESGDKDIRDACIQRFEYTYELSWKMLKRQLEAEMPDPETIDQWSKKDLFRIGAERSLVTNPDRWFHYMKNRNLTSHSYDDEKAAEVYDVLGDFISDAHDLLNNLKNRHD